MSEAELLQAFRERRSEEAFGELVRRYAGLVYSVAKRRMANAALAEDITQMVFIRLAKSPPALKTHDELAAWLHRMTVNVTIDTWRSETRRRAREEQAVTMETDTSESTRWDEVSPKLDAALNKLNDEDRRALLLRFFRKKTMREVGAVLGVSEDAAKMRVSRAVERLRTQMGFGVACTTVGLGALLTEHSVEAAPAPLLTQLAAIRLPAVAGVAGLAGGLMRLSKAIFSAGTLAGLLIVAGMALHFANRSPARTISSTQNTDSGTETNGRVGDSSRIDTYPAANARAPVTSVPANPPRIRFYVLDTETGRGLEGAQVNAYYFGVGGQGEGHELVTDDTGYAPIPDPDDLSKNTGPNVFVKAKGYVPKVVGFRSAVAEYIIKLDPAMTVGGRVIDENGRSVADVNVDIRSAGNKAGEIENVDFRGCTSKTGADGTWSGTWLPRHSTNEVSFIVTKPGYKSTTIILPEQNLDINHLIFVIDRGRVITGQITDNRNTPVANARLKIIEGDTNERQSAKSDGAGFFTLEGVAGQNQDGVSWGTTVETTSAGEQVLRGSRAKGPLHIHLVVQAEGFAPQILSVPLPESRNAINITLLPGNVFRGRILEENGAPLANAVARTDYDFQHQIEDHFEWLAKTDAAGHFEWDSAPTGEVCYWFEAEGYPAIRSRPFQADGTEHDITLKH